MKSKGVTTTGQMREALALAMEKCARGELPSLDGRNLIGLANQITTSVAVEIKHQNMQISMGKDISILGDLEIGSGQTNN